MFCRKNLLRILTGLRMTSWLFSRVEELSLGPPNTNPCSGKERDLNPGPPDYISSALTTRPRRVLIKKKTRDKTKHKNNN